jgi:hypothetical protein
MPPFLKTRPRLSTIFALSLAASVSAAALVAYFRTHARETVASVNLKSRADEIPPTVLWAWERPEDLRFVDSRETGVAFLSRTVYLRGEETVVRPRLQPLEVRPQTFLVAVVRIETDRRDRPALSPAQIEKTVAAANEAANAKGVRALQIDFDAVVSERDFYRSLLSALREKLPERTPLSITALASWCLGDNWLAGLDVDEAVPMLFRMGVDERRVREFLDAGGEFREPRCQGSAGLSTDEKLHLARRPARRYVFSPRAWTEESARAVIEENER